MIKNDMERSPIIIGGMGGSGTRVVAELCHKIGLFMGSDTNRAEDNLFFTLLFRRKTWLKKMIQRKKSFSTAISVHHKMILGQKRLTWSELGFLCYAVLDMSLHYRDDWRWPFRRLFTYLKCPSIALESWPGWGWKEPNTLLLVQKLSDFYPNMKYIHTVRHGLDMAFSPNQRQLRAMGDLFGLPEQHPGQERPEIAFSYWVQSNLKAKQEGNKLGNKRYFLLNFDKLCKSPVPIVEDLVDFLEIHVEPSQIDRLSSIPKIPKSVGRYKSRNLSAFSAGDLLVLEEFGFEIERE